VKFFNIKKTIYRENKYQVHIFHICQRHEFWEELNVVFHVFFRHEAGDRDQGRYLRSIRLYGWFTTATL